MKSNNVITIDETKKSYVDPNLFYLEQSKFTGPGKYQEMYDILPDNIEDLCDITSTLLFSTADLESQDIKSINPEKIQTDITYLTVEEMLDGLSLRSKKDLIKPRVRLSERVATNCRNSSLLLCSMLRHKGIPARMRMGFNCYMHGWVFHGIFHDKALVEYWCSKDCRWKLVDNRLTKFNLERFRIKFSKYDIPNDKFMTAPQIWLDCIYGKRLANDFGCGGVPGATSFRRGLWYIRNMLIHDLFMLNKVELSFWYTWGYMFSHVEKDQDLLLDKNQMTLFSDIAEVLCSGLITVEEVQKLFNRLKTNVADEVVSRHPHRMGHKVII